MPLAAMNSPLRKKGPLFTICYNKFIRDPSVHYIEKIVFLCIKSHKDSDDQCIPPIDQIASELNMDRKTIYASLSRLEAHGLLTRSRRSEGGNQIENQYFFQDLH